jgi:hypothetical protein
MDEIEYQQTCLAKTKGCISLFVAEDADGASGQHGTIFAKDYARKL